MNPYYDFVDFLKPKPFNTEGYLTGKLQLKIKTLVPLFIGSGIEYYNDDNELYKCFIHCNNKPVIPGSTIKGVLRTISQGVSYSCVEVDKSITEDLPFINKNCRCIVCKTYGKMGLKGMVNFGDFLLETGEKDFIKIPIQMSPDITKREVYYKNNKLIGIKFYRHGDYRIANLDKEKAILLEVVMENATFKGEIIFHNLNKTQLELLCYSLGLDKSITPKIGGNKSGYFGSCSFEVIKSVIGKNEFDTNDYAKRYGEDSNDIKANKLKLSEILDYKNKVMEL